MTTAYGYDALGEQTSQTDAQGQTTTTAYDADGRATLVTTPNDRQQAFYYDSLGRQSGQIWYSAPQSGVRLPANVIVSRYDASGDQLMTSNSTSVYDNANRLIDWTMTVTSGTSTTVERVATPYNAAGIVMTEDRYSGSADVSRTSFKHDGVGNLIEQDDSLFSPSPVRYEIDTTLFGFTPDGQMSAKGSAAPGRREEKMNAGNGYDLLLVAIRSALTFCLASGEGRGLMAVGGHTLL